MSACMCGFGYMSVDGFLWVFMGISGCHGSTGVYKYVWMFMGVMCVYEYL